MEFGDLEVHLLTDGLARVDPGGMFGLVPRALYGPTFPPDEQNLIPQALTCLLVRSESQTIVIDTGLGSKLSEKEQRNWGLAQPSGRLIEFLDGHGVGPEDVDHVINTHLHWDHCGGNTRLADGAVVPTFPNAVYWVQRLEWVDACHPNARTRGTYFESNFSPMVADGRFRLLNGDYTFNRHIQCVVTPGHTRAHQSILISSGDWQALFVADMASYSIHIVRTAWLTAYDVLPLENITTKKRWQAWAARTGAWLIFQHDPYRPVARLTEREGRFALEDIPEAEELTAEIPILQLPHG